MAIFDIEPTDEIIPQSGLALLGLLLSEAKLTERLDQLPTESGHNSVIPNSDVANSYLGLLVQGKTEIDHIEAYRDNPLAKRAKQKEDEAQKRENSRYLVYTSEVMNKSIWNL